MLQRETISKPWFSSNADAEVHTMEPEFYFIFLNATALAEQALPKCWTC